MSLAPLLVSRIARLPSRKLLVEPLCRLYAASSVAANKEGLLLSDSCVKRLQQLCDNGDKQYLRVTVEGGGCSGFQYKFDLESDIDVGLSEDDRLFERDGAKVVTDETSLEYLKGSTVDYHSELIRAAFRIIDNPLAEQGCSCGASFTIKID